MSEQKRYRMSASEIAQHLGSFLNKTSCFGIVLLKRSDVALWIEQKLDHQLLKEISQELQSKHGARLLHDEGELLYVITNAETNYQNVERILNPINGCKDDVESIDPESHYLKPMGVRVFIERQCINV